MLNDIKKYFQKREIKKEEEGKNESKKRKVIKTIVEWLLYVIIFFLIVLGTPRGLSMLLHTEYPIASITSSSMWPILKQGDIVLIKGESDKNGITIGDIVVYRQEKGFIIHRVVELNDNNFVTKGDANLANDEPVEYSRLVGKTLNFKNKPVRIPLLGKLSQIVK